MDQIPAAMDRHLEVVHCHKGICVLFYYPRVYAVNS